MSPEEIAAQDERTRIADEIETKQRYAEMRRRDRLAFTSLSQEDLDKHTFESMTVMKQNERMIQTMLEWSPESRRGAVLWGNVGTGKSALCKCLINKWASVKLRCLFIFVGEAMDNMKNAMDSKETSVAIETQKLITPELLVFDDLGAEKGSEWQNEKIFSVFEQRAKVRKITFFTSNLGPEEIRTKYGPRIHDRMVEFCRWLRFEGESFRKMNYKTDAW